MAFKVRVKNFQSIQDAELEVSGLTAITGPNNTGKSALLRAVRGVFQNTRGTAFVRHGAPKCSVELGFDDGHTVKWEKGPKTKPTYVVDGGKPIHPGQGVPDEVRDLGVAPVVAGGRDVWPQVAPQLSGQVFLLDEPGSVLAEAVANVDRVGRLNRALKASEKDRRTAAAELKVRLSDRDKYKAELAIFEGLDKAVEEVEAIEEDAHQTGRIAKALAGVTALRERVTRFRSTVESLEGIERVTVPEGRGAREALGKWEVVQSLHLQVVTLRSRVDKLEGVESIEVDFDETGVTKLVTALGTIRALRDRLDQAKLRISGLEAEAGKREDELAGAETEVVEVLGDLGECPTCGAVTTGEHNHDAVEGLCREDLERGA